VSTIAVIQPYFFPYAGYFRLFDAADTVVMFDCVQFPRRGWVHRNRFALANGSMDWLTLPIVKTGRDARIEQLRFPADALIRLSEMLYRFPILDRARRSGHAMIGRLLEIAGEDVTSYLVGLLRDVTAALGIERNIVRSSSLQIDPELRAQDRVIAIVRALGGTRYVNPSGGRDLYDHAAFRRAELDLRFLAPYEASMESILSRLIAEPVDAISDEIKHQTILVS
jgi:hypothetical protein